MTPAEYGRKNRVRLNAYRKAWAARNPEKQKAYRKTWSDSHPERVAELKRIHDARYYRRNAEAIKAYVASWVKANPEHVRFHKHARRHGLAGDQRLTPGLTKLLLLEQNNSCSYCDADLSVTGYHVDHYLPLALGGENLDSNIQLTLPAMQSTEGREAPARFSRNRTRKGCRMSPLLLILLVILIIGCLGSGPWYGYSRSWGYAPFGGIGLILVILIIFLLF